MAPTDKANNFVDDSIGGIHVIRFSGKALHEYIKKHKGRPELTKMSKGYVAPTYEASLSQHRRHGLVGFDQRGVWYDR